MVGWACIVVPVDGPYTWQKMESSEVSSNALAAGKGSDNIFLAIGEVNGRLSLGIVQHGSSYLVMRYTNEATIVTDEDFSALTVDPSAEVSWTVWEKEHLSENVVSVRVDNNLLFVGRASINGETTLGFFRQSSGCIYRIHEGTLQK